MKKKQQLPNSPVKLAEQAEAHKNDGNVCYKEAKYREAIECYTKAIGLHLLFEII